MSDGGLGKKRRGRDRHRTHSRASCGEDGVGHRRCDERHRVLAAPGLASLSTRSTTSCGMSSMRAESGIAWGLSATLGGKIDFRNGAAVHPVA